MDIEQILDIQLSFLKEKELKEALAKEASVHSFKAGKMILSEAHYVSQVPIVLSGVIKVYKEEADKELLIYYIYPLESCIVSIHCGLNSIKPRVKAITEEDVSILSLPSHLIASWQNKYPSFNTYIVNLYQKRFDDVLTAFNDLAFQNLDGRLMSYLTAKARALQSDSVGITHHDLANELGVARESISRMLKKLENEKKVVLHRGKIELTATQ